MMELLEQFEHALLAADRLNAQKIFLQSQQDSSLISLIDNAIVPAMEKIGKGWETGDVSLSQVYMSARICDELADTIIPLPEDQKRIHSKIAIAVLDDYHVLGKKIVSAILRSSGFEFLDYHHVTAEELFGHVKNDKIDILLISVLMFPSALKIKNVRTMLQKQNLATKIIVGGAPFRFDDQLWQEVGADAMGKTASDAVNLIMNIGGAES